MAAPASSKDEHDYMSAIQLPRCTWLCRGMLGHHGVLLQQGTCACRRCVGVHNSAEQASIEMLLTSGVPASEVWDPPAG